MSQKIIITIVLVIIIILGIIILVSRRNNRETISSETNEPITTELLPSPVALSPDDEATPASNLTPTDVGTTETAGGLNAQSIVVTYNDAGFSPASITVGSGATVIFKNESGQSMWPASNPHPIHTAYSEFDAKAGFTNGQSYSFTFTKTGNFKYHNHLSPSDGGTIVVQ